jgi:hypothetical protein
MAMACSPQLLRFVANGEARLALEQCERDSEREEEMARAGPGRSEADGRGDSARDAFQRLLRRIQMLLR